MADPVASAALAALDSAVSGLAWPPPPAGLSRQLNLSPNSIRPRGLGGYVGEHAAPRGAVQARLVDAILELRVSGGSDTAASDYLGRLAGTLLTQHHGELRARGIERLRRHVDDVADPRQARFDVSFEYRQLPQAGEGLIDTLDLGFDTNLTPYRARYRFDLAMRTLAGASNPLAGFVPADDTDLNAASPVGAWSYDALAGCIAQTAATRGGALTVSDSRKAGAQLLWRLDGAPLALAHFIAVVEFESTSQDGIGLVFGRTGANERLHFLASQRNGYHVFGRKAGAGAWGVIGEPAAAGFTTGVRHTLVVTVFDHTLRASLDGVQTLEVQTPTPVPAGEIGFFTHGNNGARMHRARLIELL